MATFINGHLHIDLSRAPPYNTSTTLCKQDAKLQPITTNLSNNTSKSACKAVLSTTELLELILLRLPIIDILSCTQISKYFLDLIESSKAIRTHLLNAETPMYTIPSYGKHIPIPNTWLHRTSLAAGNVVRTHFIVDVDRGKMMLYDSGKGNEGAVYAFMPRGGNFVKILGDGDMELKVMKYTGSVIWKDAEGKNAVCRKSFGWNFDAYEGRWRYTRNNREDPGWVVRDYFLGVQKERQERIEKNVLSERRQSVNVGARTSKRKAIVRALLRFAVRARRPRTVYVGVDPT